MAPDLLEKLADVPVPPPPPSQKFDRAIHRRINDRLIVGQVCDLVLRGFGFAIAHFACATLGMLRLTFTGRLEGPKNDRPKLP